MAGFYPHSVEVNDIEDDHEEDSHEGHIIDKLYELLNFAKQNDSYTHTIFILDNISPYI